MHARQLHASQPAGNQGITKLNISVFSGDSLHWQSFWDCFEAAMHCSPSLAGVQKLNYLQAELRGMQRELWLGSQSPEQFMNIQWCFWESDVGGLMLVNAHMQALLGLAGPADSLAALWLFCDSVGDHIRSYGFDAPNVELCLFANASVMAHGLVAFLLLQLSSMLHCIFSWCLLMAP